jgi:rhodanese-related sulfurtransferase
LLRQVDSRPDLNVIVLSTEAGQQVREWLDNNEGRNPLVARASSLARLGVTGTPTVLIVDSSGTITDMSVGALEAGEQQRFVGRLMNDVGEPLASKDFRTDEVTGVDLAAISDRGAIQFVDVGDREAFRLSLRENVVNIPIDELEIRAPNELSRSQPIVLDASHGGLVRCRAAAHLLRSVGFSDVAILVQSSQ